VLLIRRLVAPLVIAGAVAALAVGPLSLSTSAQSAPVFGYAATASADGVRIVVEARGYILVDRFVDLGAPAAQAALDASGASQGFAAAPDPGELVAVAPGLVATLVPIPLPLPQYPLIASSAFPTTPSSKLSTGPYVLEATSTERSSHARAEVGGTAEDSVIAATRAVADVALDDELGRLTTSAAAVTDGVDLLGGVVRIGRVESRASMTQTAGDKAPTIESGFSVTGATILGLGLAVTDKGLTIAGQSVPLGLGDSLTGILSDLNLGIRVLPEVRTADSASSAGLEITQRVDLPNAPEPATVSIILGRASVSLTPPQTDPTGGGDDEVGAPPVDDGLAPTPDALDGTLPDLGGPVSPPAPPGFPSGPSVPEIAPDVEPIANRAVAGFYLVFVLAAAVSIGGGQLLRLLSVRWAWTR
jgi:hypothetical protein